MNNAYECSVCKACVVRLQDGKLIRTCKHAAAPVHANMSAVVSQDGGVSLPSRKV